MMPIVADGIEWSVCRWVGWSAQSWALRKGLNRSRCRLGCGLRFDQGTMYYIGAHWRHLANTIEPSMCGGDAALCQITLTSWLLFQKHFSAISHRGFPTELQYSIILISLKCPQNSEQQNPQNFTNFRAGSHSAMQRYITKSKENTNVKQWFCIVIRFRSGGSRTKIRRRTTY